MVDVNIALVSFFYIKGILSSKLTYFLLSFVQVDSESQSPTSNFPQQWLVVKEAHHLLCAEHRLPPLCHEDRWIKVGN